MEDADAFRQQLAEDEQFIESLQTVVQQEIEHVVAVYEDDGRVANLSPEEIEEIATEGVEAALSTFRGDTDES